MSELGRTAYEQPEESKPVPTGDELIEGDATEV